MNYKTLISLALFANTLAIAQKPEVITLRNGAQASAERVDKVYQALKNLYAEGKGHWPYYALWRVAKLGKEMGKDISIATEVDKY